MTTETTYDNGPRRTDAEKNHVTGGEYYATRPATQKQIHFIVTLLTEIAGYSDDERAKARKLHQGYRELHAEGKFTMKFASDAITALKKGLTYLQGASKPQWPAVSTGRYAYLKDENDPESVAFFHVVVTDSGFPLLWVYSSDEELPIKSVPQKMSILSKIKDLGELECMKFFGQKSTTCGECGRRLTTPESRDIGIGPKCLAKRMG